MLKQPLKRARVINFSNKYHELEAFQYTILLTTQSQQIWIFLFFSNSMTD